MGFPVVYAFKSQNRHSTLRRAKTILRVPLAGANEDSDEELHITTSPEFLTPTVIRRARAAFARRAADNSRLLLLCDTGKVRLQLKRYASLVEGCVERVRLVSPAAFKRLLIRRASVALTHGAVELLRTKWPMYSASNRRPIGLYLFVMAFIGISLLGFADAASGAKLFLSAAISLPFLFICFSRLFAALENVTEPLHNQDSDEDWNAQREWPTYSVLVPLYREERAVPGLVSALRSMDYPPDKLEIFFLTEAEDRTTRRALEEFGAEEIGIILETNGPGPRTKPRALQMALPLSTSQYVTVYDAEDRPDPYQIKKAVRAFESEHERVGCLQAKLVIRNSEENFLTKQFALEYAAHFDGLLPYLAGFGVPLALGGTSNHFRREALEMVGGWDPFNVTEDADLGLRLSRFGWASSILHSHTYEEAPEQFKVWLSQRTRWFKGWMQTLEVHSRHPLRLLRDMGFAHAVLSLSVTGAFVFSALIHPIVAIWLLTQLVGVFVGDTAPTSEHLGILVLTVANTLIAYVSTILLYAATSKRRGLSLSAGALALVPFYWFCQSIAAYRAVFQFLFDPFRWEKTPHGLSQVCNEFDETIVPDESRPQIRPDPSNIFLKQIAISLTDPNSEGHREGEGAAQAGLRRTGAQF